MNNAPANSKGSNVTRLLLKAMLILFGTLILAAVGLWFFVNSEKGAQWSGKVIRDRFPEVAVITPTELDTWMNDLRRPQPLLIDVRTQEEQQVSTLPGARCVSPDAPASVVLEGVDRSRPVVVYCAAGYRGAVMARRLHESGLTAVQNLEGGIFAWANSGHRVEKNGVPTSEVHPYSSVFSRMLKKRSK